MARSAAEKLKSTLKWGSLGPQKSKKTRSAYCESSLKLVSTPLVAVPEIAWLIITVCLGEGSPVYSFQ